MFPVKLLKNYRPLGKFQVFAPVEGSEDEAMEWRDPIGTDEIRNDEDKITRVATGEQAKVWADTVIRLPIDEARNVVERKLAIRNDPIPA